MAKRYIKLIQVSGDKEREVGQLSAADFALITYLIPKVTEGRLIVRLRAVMSAIRQFWPEEE